MVPSMDAIGVVMQVIASGLTEISASIEIPWTEMTAAALRCFLNAVTSLLVNIYMLEIIFMLLLSE